MNFFDALSRRDFGHLSLAAMVSLLHSGLSRNAFAGGIESEMEVWLRGLHQLCGDLKRSRLTPLEWQDQIHALFARVALEDFLRAIDFRALTKGLELPHQWGAIRKVRFPRLEGLSAVPGGEKLFVYARNAATAPHAHNNMVSAHFILKGKIHVRTWHRIRDEDDHIIIKPSIDRIAGPGEMITMSDERDNIHWFLSLEDGSCTFNLPVTGLYEGKYYGLDANKYHMIYMDPLGRRLEGDLIRTPVLSFRQAEARYSRSG